MKSSRNQSVELLRCGLMFLIILCHAFGKGLWSDSLALWTLIFTVGIHWHVDGFIAISGWYGIRFSWMKYARLWGLFAFYSVLSVLYALFIEKRPLEISMIKISGGWFGGAS